MALSWSGPRFLHDGRGPEVQTATPSPVHSSLWAFKAGPRLLNVPHQPSLFLIPFQAPSRYSWGRGWKCGQVGAGGGVGGMQGGELSCPSGWGGPSNPCLRLQGPLLLPHPQS